MTFQDLILTLQHHWARAGCILAQAYDLEVGAGTMAPTTFLRALGPEPWNVAYVQPSRRPADGRFGENPNRLFQHHQFQVILKPAPKNVQELYLDSLRGHRHRPAGARPPLRRGRLGVAHARRLGPRLGGLVRRAWRSPSSPTSSSAAASSAGRSPPSSPTGSSASAMYLQNVENVFDIEWVKGVKYGEVFHAQRGGDEHATPSRASDPQMLFALFDTYEKECKRLLERELPLPAYDYALKCSPHLQPARRPRGDPRHRARRLHQARARQRPRSAPRATSRCASELGFPLLKTGVDGRPAAPAARGQAGQRASGTSFLAERKADERGPALRDRHRGAPAGVRGAGAGAAPARSCSRAATEARLAHGAVAAFGTPRRLAVLRRGAWPTGATTPPQALGPSVKAAFDADGKPTKAATKFAESAGRGGRRSSSARRRPRASTSAAEVTEAGRPASALLRACSAPRCTASSFTKSHALGRRGADLRPAGALARSRCSGRRWSRCVFADVKSGRMTYGHRFLSPGPHR